MFLDRDIFFFLQYPGVNNATPMGKNLKWRVKGPEMET